MADTEFTTDAVETVKRWATRLWIELPREIYWGKFMKEGDQNAIIEVKNDLKGQSGDKLTFTLLRKLSGGGVLGDDTLEGNEEQLLFYSDDITLNQQRNAVRLKGKLSERRTAFDQRMAAKNQLKTWLAETIDDDIFTQFDTNPTTVVFGGNATNTADITSGSTITVAKIDTLVAKAKKASPKIWPVRIGGDDYYVLVLHTDVMYDLQRSTGYDQTQRDTGIRGDENPIFTGRNGIYRGTVIHDHEKIPISTTYGATGDLPGASNFFLGRQAGLFGWGTPPEMWEKEFDFGNKVAYAIGAIWDMTKAVFNGSDHAMIGLRTYRTNN